MINDSLTKIAADIRAVAGFESCPNDKGAVVSEKLKADLAALALRIEAIARSTTVNNPH